MITKEVFDFLSELSQNNNKVWFDANKRRYESVRKQLLDFAGSWIINFGKDEPFVVGMDPKKCMFRINRDVRFSANKDPYKTNMGTYLCDGGKNSELGGYYLHIEPGKCFFGGGIYMPTAPQLEKIRQEIDYNLNEWTSIVASKDFVGNFGELSRENTLKKAPKGYEESNPAIAYLKLKSFVASKPLDDKVVLQPNFLETLISLSKSIQPMIHFLNRACG
ncbi:MAG: DUF2461 domain-containing protein [Chitinophagales bacterium]|nr:DUF2461 domain-containing protein [Chitinophagales bacterium]